MKRISIGSPLRLAKSFLVTLALIFIITSVLRAETPTPKVKSHAPNTNSDCVTHKNSVVKSVEAFDPLALSVPVFIQPLGDFATDDLPVITSALETQFRVKVIILPIIPLPGNNMRTAKGRYRAEALLDFLGEKCPNSSKILGLTNQDISMAKGTKNDWGVFGLGDYCGSASIVSSYRIKAKSVSRAKLLALIARHELGHNFGLKHCEDSLCLMAAGDDLSNDSANFCANCAKKIVRYLKTSQ